MKTLKRVNYKGSDCWLIQSQYGYGGSPALQLIDAQDGEPVATCTVNMPDYNLAEGEICIKDYSENEGMLDFLVKEGIVEDTGKRLQSGYVTIPVCRLL